MACTRPVGHDAQQCVPCLRDQLKVFNDFARDLPDLFDGAQLNQCPNDPPCDQDGSNDYEEWCGMCLLITDLKTKIAKLPVERPVFGTPVSKLTTDEQRWAEEFKQEGVVVVESSVIACIEAEDE